jgi:hypothetical protein
MSILITALALAGASPVAVPATGAPVATPAPAPAKKPCCCEKMDRPMACCEKHGEGSEHPEVGADPHAGHDMNH